MTARDHATAPLPWGGFQFQHSNSLERLAARLADVITGEQRRAPLRPVSVTVPHAGVGIWLKQYLAQRLGAAANLEFPQPTELVWRLARAAIGDDRVGRARELDAAALTLGIHEALVREADSPSLAPIQRYLQRAGAGDPDKARLGLAAALARLYGDYAIYRPEWIERWSRGDAVTLRRGQADEPWQRALWRAVWERAAAGAVADNPGSLLSELLEAPPPPGRPLLLFGISHLPPRFVEVLHWASTARPVHLFMPSPCREYWSDAQGERRRLEERVRRAGALPAAEIAGPEVIPNDLLASLGRMGQEFLGMIAGLDDQLPHDQEAGYREPVGGTRLAWLQRALLRLDAPPIPADAEHWDDEASIEIHACHSRLREVEVLHDQVLAWLDPVGAHAAARYRARDILVVAPDIDAYAPFVRAVFGTAVQRQPPIPYNISDRKPVDAHPVVQAFLELIDLPISDFESEAVVALLETPAIARRLACSEEELVRIRNWAAELHVHWGIDDEHRSQRGGGDMPRVNTWRHGVDRLLLGLASMQDSRLFEAADTVILPFPEVEGSGAEAAGKLAAWIARLDALRRTLGAGERSAAAWQRLLSERIVDALFQPGFDDREELAAEQALRDALDDLAGAADRAGVANAALSWRTVRELLRDRLGEAVAQRRFLSRGITFANTVPLRAVPARIVCMLGMNAGEFPRATPPRAFDLLALDRRFGDRDPRQEDRYLFLETILAAGNQLYLSYVGRDQHENDERDPSPLLNELQASFERAGFPLPVREHPLQPFSARNFGRGSDGEAVPPRSYHDVWLPAAKAFAAGVGGVTARFFEPAALLPPLPVADSWPDTVSLTELVRFLRSPAKHYLRSVLDARLDDHESTLRAAHEINALTNWQIAQAVNRLAIESELGERPAWPDEVEAQRAWMPAGQLGEVLVDRAWRPVLVDAVREELRGRVPEVVEIDAAVPVQGRSVRVVGRVEHCYDGQLIRWATSAMHGRRWLPFLVDWAALAAVGSAPEPLVIHKAGRNYRPAPLPPVLADPPAGPTYLAQLLECYLRGFGAALAFFPQSAFIYQQAIDKGEDGETAAGKAADAFFPNDGGTSFGGGRESDKCAYARTLTRGWRREELACGQFRRAAALVFGRRSEGGGV